MPRGHHYHSHQHEHYFSGRGAAVEHGGWFEHDHQHAHYVMTNYGTSQHTHGHLPEYQKTLQPFTKSKAERKRGRVAAWCRTCGHSRGFHRDGRCMVWLTVGEPCLCTEFVEKEKAS